MAVLEQAWLSFRLGLREIAVLLDAAAAAPVVPGPGEMISKQQVYIRSAIVILAAHLEGFFKALPTEYTDQIGGASWERLTPGVQRFIALQAIKRLELAFEDAGPCVDPHKTDSVRRNVLGTGRWFSHPGRIAETSNRPKLEDFYRQRGAQAIERLIAGFHPELTPFFAWLAARGFDRGKFWTVVEGLVYARNQIAHGDAQMSLTLAEVRGYTAVCAVLVRQVRVYVA